MVKWEVEQSYANGRPLSLRAPGFCRPGYHKLLEKIMFHIDTCVIACHSSVYMEISIDIVGLINLGLIRGLGKTSDKDGESKSGTRSWS